MSRQVGTIPEEFCIDSIIKNNVKASLYYIENNPIKHGIVDNGDERHFKSTTLVTSLPGANKEDDNLEADLEGFAPGSRLSK